MNRMLSGMVIMVLAIFLQGCCSTSSSYTCVPSPPTGYPPNPFQPVTLMGWYPPSITYRDYHQAPVPNETFYTSIDEVGWGRPVTGMYGL